MLKLGRQLIGNLDEVTDLRLIGPPKAPTQLVLATNSPTIRMFDLNTMSCSAMLSGHTDTVLVLDAIHAKGKNSMLFLASEISYICFLLSWCLLFCLALIVQLRELKVNVHADSKTLLASGAKDNSVRVWDNAGACLAVGQGHVGAVSALAFSRRSLNFLVSGGADKLLKVDNKTPPSVARFSWEECTKELTLVKLWH